jgi:hypothetical protein
LDGDLSGAIDEPKKKESRLHWKESEQRKYVNYLVENRKYFELSIKEKKARGIHTKLGRLIKSRSSNQCRSHHQKMLQKFGSITGIIEGFRSLICNRNLQKLVIQTEKTEVPEIKI